MSTNIIAKSLSRTYLLGPRGSKFAEEYADKMKARGYTVNVIQAAHCILVDVMRKR